MQLGKPSMMWCFCTSDLLIMEPKVLQRLFKEAHRRSTHCGLCCWLGFTYRGPHRHISFSACCPLWENRQQGEFGCPQPMSPWRRGCPGAPCNVAGISRACLLTCLPTESGENELCLKVKLLVCPACRELSEHGNAGGPGEHPCKRGRNVWHPTGSSPWGPGCKYLGWIWPLAQGAGEALVYNRLRAAVIHSS